MAGRTNSSKVTADETGTDLAFVEVPLPPVVLHDLQADGRTVYVLHFTGLRDKLQRIQNQTDAIARSFRLKQ